MKPLILITNDDGVYANGIRTLISVACEMGDVIVMAPQFNASGLSHSFTSSRPIRVNKLSDESGCTIYSCDGTPVDCVKLAQEHFCPRTPDLVLSGINHGSNSSVNILYSGTMGAVVEASANGYQAIGFSLIDYGPEADFEPTIPYVRSIISDVLENGLPAEVSLNVNIPVPDDGIIKGIRVCRQARARWEDAYEKRFDPRGRPYYWISGRFVCDDVSPDTDEWALNNGYISIVPVTPDYTEHSVIEKMKERFG